MGATTSASVPLPDDEACEAVLRKFIAEDLERAERLLHRAAELLGGWFMVFSRGAWCGRIQCVPRVRTLRLVTEARRNSQNVWSINGLDGTTHQLPVDETDANVTRQHLTAKSWVNLLKQTLKVFVFGVFMPLKTWISREKLLRGSRKEAARI